MERECGVYAVHECVYVHLCVKGVGWWVCLCVRVCVCEERERGIVCVYVCVCVCM